MVYKNFTKPLIEFFLALIGTAVLLIPMIIISAAVFIDDPGPVLFKQKRVGKKKNGEITYFNLYKFRSMKMSTPHDKPTHLLNHPEQYITRVGRILRKTSLDEIVQIPLNILTLKMSVIGPRPALWNQEDLIAERDKYGANDIRPGLTGWAQINGRDELEIPIKAKLDGEYAEKLSRGGFSAFALDCRCLFGTIFSVLKSDGVVEGGTGAMEKQKTEEQSKEPALK